MALVVALGVGTGLAFAAFTVHLSTPQEITAADSFGPPPTAPGELEADSRTNDGGATSAQVQLGLRLRNVGDGPAPLGEVRLRYWFTDDGGGEPVTACYFATFGCEKLRLDVVPLTELRDGADSYLSVGFTAGSLEPGQSAALDQLAFRDPVGHPFRQDNDFSFLAQDSFTTNSK